MLTLARRTTLELCLVLAPALAALTTIAQSSESVISYADRPDLAPDFFLASMPADSLPTFQPQLQYGTGLGSDKRSQFGIPAWEARAIAFPRVNYTGAKGRDSTEAMAYFEAMWQIAGYHGLLLKSRLRREVGAQGLFAAIGNAYQAEAIQSAVMAEWNAANKSFSKQADYGQDYMRSLAFADEYRRAADTVTFPSVVLRPNGMEVHFLLGPTFPLGELTDGLDAGFGMDLGIGYTYDRWLALLLGSVSQTPVSGAASEREPGITNGRSQWNNVGLDLGYRWLRTPSWEATARLRTLSATLHSGSGDNQEDLREDFALGLAQSLSYSFGGGYGGEQPGSQRSGLQAMALVGLTPQKWLGALRGPVLYVGLGLQGTIYGVGYERE